MASVVIPKIKEEPLLVNPDYFGDPQVANFISCWQINGPFYTQISCGDRLRRVTGYKASSYII